VSVPRVYGAISAVIAELSINGIGKRHVNRRDRYDYRSVDDLYARLAPLLAAHKLCVLPRILSRSEVERTDERGCLVTNVTVRAAFDIVSAEDGSRHVIKSFGEAFDTSDKATAKAITAAYKQALFQAFCIPCAEIEDPDTESIRVRGVSVVEPIGGWSAWGQQLLDDISGSGTSHAVEELQARNRETLRALAMHDAPLYAEIGEAVRARKAMLNGSAQATSLAKSPKRAVARPSRKAVRAKLGRAHA
jgi:hypothetical protein